MHLKILTLNCGKGFVPGLENFLARICSEGTYDFVLLQELCPRTTPPLDAELRNSLGEYSLLRAFNAPVNAWSELAIAYRKSFTLQESNFFPFTQFKKGFNADRAEFGLLTGVFATPEGRMLIGSVHMNSQLQFVTRAQEAKFTKQLLTTHNPEKLPVIFGGDFNTGLWWEKLLNRHIFAPEFANVTNDSGPTVDSRYVEPLVAVNRIAIAMGKLGLALRMKVDHIYLDHDTATTHATACRVLPDRVSDHSPMEVAVSP